MRKLSFILISGALALLSCTDNIVGNGQPDQIEAAKFIRLVDQLGLKDIRQSPENASALALSEAEFGGRYKDLLDNYSQAAFERMRVVHLEALDHLSRINSDRLSPALRRQYQVIEAMLTNSSDISRYGHGQVSLTWISPYAMNQIDGAYLNLPDFLDFNHPIESMDDLTAYLLRLSQVSKAIRDQTARFIWDFEANITPPNFIIERMISLAKGIAPTDPKDSPYITILQDKLDSFPALSPEIKAQSLDRALALVTTKISPAYTDMIDALAARLPKASQSAGIWQIPHGDVYYKDALKFYTTTDMDAQSIHELGLHLVEKISREMHAILVSEGYETGSVGLRMAQIGAENRFIYANTDADRQQLIADLNIRLNIFNARLGDYIGTLPSAEVEIRPVPPLVEESAPGGYYESPSLDGQNPGVFYINLRDMADWPSWSLPTLLYHEASPGHHTQIALASEAGDQPYLIRTGWFSAYGEGWALYAEDLAAEMGVYLNDPYGQLGYLQSLLFRAARLVVDTGLHHKRWTREAAIDYMVEITGQTRASMEIEVDRYCVWPGQATAYMIGRERIRALRAEAETRLGSRFDIRVFHDQILAGGGRPLDVLETDIKDWIEAQRNSEG